MFTIALFFFQIIFQPEELAVEQGELVFVKEVNANCDYFLVTSDKNSGRIPCNFGIYIWIF